VAEFDAMGLYFDFRYPEDPFFAYDPPGWCIDLKIEIRYPDGSLPQGSPEAEIARRSMQVLMSASDPRIGPCFFGGINIESRFDLTGEHVKRYSRGYSVTPDQLEPGGPRDKYKVPFLFATNGRPFLRQLASKSGIWFLDGRRAENLSRALEGWYTPEDLLAMLKQDIDKAEEQLKTEPTEYLGLRDYQLAAIRAVESAIEKGERTDA